MADGGSVHDYNSVEAMRLSSRPTCSFGAIEPHCAAAREFEQKCNKCLARPSEPLHWNP